MKRPEKIVLRRPAQVAALASPVRARILDLLSAHGPLSIAEIAERSGRPRTAFYYHMKILCGAGIVELAETRKARRRDEAVYRMAAPKIAIDSTRRSREYRRALAKGCASFLRRAGRDYESALGAPTARTDGGRRNLAVRRFAVRLGDEGLERLNRHLEKIAGILDRHRVSAGGTTLALTIVMSPIEGDE